MAIARFSPRPGRWIDGVYRPPRPDADHEWDGEKWVPREEPIPPEGEPEVE